MDEVSGKLHVHAWMTRAVGLWYAATNDPAFNPRSFRALHRSLAQRAPRLPRRRRVLVRHARHERVVEPVEVRRRLPVDLLPQVVLRRVVSLAVPSSVDALALRAPAIAEDEIRRRDPRLEERPVVGALQETALRLGIVLHGDAQRLRDRARVVAETRVVQRVHGEQLEREERAELVEVDVPDDPRSRHGEVGEEPPRTEEPLLLARDDRDDDRA